MAQPRRRSYSRIREVLYRRAKCSTNDVPVYLAYDNALLVARRGRAPNYRNTNSCRSFKQLREPYEAPSAYYANRSRHNHFF